MPDRPGPPARPRRDGEAAAVALRLADVYLALVAFLVAELVVVALVARGELILGLEVPTAASTLLPVAALLALPIALAAGAVVELASRAERAVPRGVLAGLAFAAAAAVGWGVGGGRQIVALRAPFALGLGVLVGLAVFLAAPRLARLVAEARATGRGGWIVLGAAALCGISSTLDALVLPRLYPAFHAGLLGLSVLAAAATTLGFARLRVSTRRATVALAVFAVAAAASPRAPARLAPADNLRRVFYERAPALGRVVEVTAWLEPPPPLGDGEELALGDSTSPTLDLRGRDLLLVTIDALRADHVGAYGYPRATTPNLDALAAEGVVFDRAYTATPHTSYAVGSLMTGKYLRPLLLQGLGADSETWPDHLRRYGFRTAAFFPPAVFFIDPERLAELERRDLGFEYVKKEFAGGALRVDQVRSWLDATPRDRPVFVWVHLFEPHEPYEKHPDHDFGDRDVDRYDSEIAAADQTLGELVDLVRGRSPRTSVVVTADHGEEFGDHGGYYHGTTVYEEQVRVPLVVSAPGALEARRVGKPVQLVDLLPTMLSALHVPRPARLRGADLGPTLTGRDEGPGLAFAETDSMGLLAEGDLRLVCVRRAGACSLYDLATDPEQKRDVGGRRGQDLARLRERLRVLDASHGRYEQRGLRAEGKGWPEPLRRALAGDGDSAADVASLLDDADVTIRRKAAEALFELHRPETTASLRLALAREEDAEARQHVTLALTRLGQGGDRAQEILERGEPRFRRLAALALAEIGDDAGEDVLVAWLRAAYPSRKAKAPPEPIEHERARQLVAALGRIRSEDAVPALLDALGDLRLRPFVAAALADVGEPAARMPLAEALETERYRHTRIAMVEALLKLGASYELRDPLVSLLGMPDPLPGGVDAANRADLLPHLGGPREAELRRLRKFATSGVAIDVVVPKAPAGVTSIGVRAVCRARTTDGRAGQIRVGRRLKAPSAPEKKAPVPAAAPELDAARAVVLEVPAGEVPTEPVATLPEGFGVRPGDPVSLVVYATQNVAVDACLLVPLRPELPPPPPVPWQAGEGSDGKAPPH